MDAVIQFRGTIYEGGYGLIAKNVMRDSSLPKQSKLIYAYMCSFAGSDVEGERTAFPSVELQCEELGMTEDTYYKWRKELVKRGLITIEKRKDKGKFERNLYFIEAVPVASDEDETPTPKKPLPKNSGTENEDKPKKPYPKNSGTEKSGTISNSLISNSSFITTNTTTTETIKVDNEEFQKQYPNVPVEEVSKKMIEEGRLDIRTVKQYRKCLLMKIGDYLKDLEKPASKPARPSYNKTRKPIRTELVPEGLLDNKPYVAPEVTPEAKAKMKALQERLKKYGRKDDASNG